MSSLLQFGLTNALIATLLTVLVWCVARWLRHPGVVHLLWLVVLVKLLAPPVVQVPLPQFTGLRDDQVSSGGRDVAIDLREDTPHGSPSVGSLEAETRPRHPVPAAELRAIEEAPSAADPVAASQPQTIQTVEPISVQALVAGLNWPMFTAGLWLAGSVVLLVISASRIWRFHALVRMTTEPSFEVQQLSSALAARMQLRSPVEVRLSPGAIPPLLWSLGRRHRIVIPAVLAEQLGERDLETILAHELAHVKRRDYLVRWIELAAVILYWWLPTVWWVRQQLREAEEAACDALVMETLPGRRRAYAQALVFTVETLSAVPPLPIIASGLGEGRRLIRRIERLADGPSPRLSRLRLCGLGALSLLLLPLSVNIFDAAAGEQSSETNAEADQQPQSELPAAAQAAEDPLAAERRRAIERGVAFLKDEQAADGTWDDPVGFDGGITALCTLGLLDAGVPPTNETVARALAWLREHDEPEKTYVVSLVTRVYAAAGLPEDRGRIKRNADWLASAMIDQGEYRGCWGYTAKDATRGDNSNAHYAILGLDAAEAAEVEVPENVWRAAVECWIAAQSADGSWGYKPGVEGTGSMTASGITSLAIILNRADFTDRDEDRHAAEAALDRGFAWLAKHYSITGNPVPAINRNWQRWHYYYLDALAHGCRHAGRAMIGDHEWPREVTELLLEEQQPDGYWMGAVPEDSAQMATAIALLVLAQTAEDDSRNADHEKLESSQDDKTERPVRDSARTRHDSGSRAPEKDGRTAGRGDVQLVGKILERADAIVSGRFVYHVATHVDGEVLQAVDREFCFTADEWIHRNLNSGRWTLSQDGRRMEYEVHTQPDGSNRRKLTITSSHPAGAFWSLPYPPVYLGTLWRGAAVREFLRAAHRAQAHFADEVVLNGIACQVLQWQIDREQVSAFGSRNDMLKAGGTLRLYCAPSLGYALPRIEKIDPFGTVQGRYDCFDFIEVADDLFLPQQAKIMSGNRLVEYAIEQIDLINQDVPANLFRPAIPGGTHVVDARPHQDDEVDQQGNRRVNLTRQPFRQFTTGVDYPTGLPHKLLAEMDKGVIAQPGEGSAPE